MNLVLKEKLCSSFDSKQNTVFIEEKIVLKSFAVI